MDRKNSILMCIIVAFIAVGMVNASLVCYLPLDGDPNDHSGNDYPSGDGTLAGDTHYVEGKYGQSLDFDGDKDFIQVMVEPLEGGGWQGVYTGFRPQATIAMWVRMETFPVPNPDGVDLLAARSWAAGDSNFEFHQYFGTPLDEPFFVVQHGYFEIEYPRQEIDPNSLVSDVNDFTDGWVHLAVTYDTINQESYMYVDGVPGDIFPITSGAEIKLGNYTLGGNAGGDYRYFDGQIDELYIFDQALSAEEIVDLMDGILPPMACGDNGYLKADLNADCYVNIDDFAEMALQWLQCTDPLGPECIMGD